MTQLELKNISFSYVKNEPILQDVSLTIASDERVVINARSGFGKSTLCRIAAGYETPAAGSVLIDGKPLPAKGVNPVQMIWQHPEQALDPLITIKSSLLEAGSIDNDLLAALGIRIEWLSRYPLELSGGELQRCCIARALRVRPKFLIADEVSTMLDAITQAQIWAFLMRHCRENGIGLLAVTHTPALSERIATRIVQLDA